MGEGTQDDGLGYSKVSRGLFITFEGPEGSGKTTQARILIERLKAAGQDVVYAREPGGTATGELIRGILQHDTAGETIYPETEVFLFAASRSQLVRSVIRPALARGAHVICDRFADSTTAYQGYGRGFDVEQMIAINDLAIADTVPDRTFLLDVDISLGLERLAARQRELFVASDRIEREARAFHEKVRQGYLALAARWPGRFDVLDGSRPPEEVTELIWSKVQDVLTQRTA